MLLLVYGVSLWVQWERSACFSSAGCMPMSQLPETVCLLEETESLALNAVPSFEKSTILIGVQLEPRSLNR